MTSRHGDYELDDELSRIDLRAVHGWLETAYWSIGTTMERVEKAALNSAMVIGAYLGDEQVAYARVVSDKISFSWICDVFVDPSHRGKGIAKSLIWFAMDHPDFKPMRRWVLVTRDAHSVYSELGFQPLENPENWMILRGEPSVAGSP